MVPGYIQYLRSFTTDVSHRAIYFVEAIGNAVLQADGLHYDYIPLPRGPDVHNPMTFRQWIVANADPTFRTVPVDLSFTSALERYSSYLETDGFHADREVFLHDRHARVMVSFGCLADMPYPEVIPEAIERYAHEYDESYMGCNFRQLRSPYQYHTSRYHRSSHTGHRANNQRRRSRRTTE
jgi:hypothetical protein